MVGNHHTRESQIDGAAGWYSHHIGHCGVHDLGQLTRRLRRQKKAVSPRAQHKSQQSR